MRRRMALVAATVAAMAGLVAAGLPTAGSAQTGRAAPSAPAGGIVVEDITIQVPNQDPVQAYVVRPAGNLKKNSAAGVLFLHWLGEINNDRSEYLTEAITLAGQGVVSVLPQGYFPWVPNPDGTTGDVTLVENQVAAMRPRARPPGVGEGCRQDSRIALVGHDYGAMYGSILADSDHRVSAMVLEAPDALMGNWFAQFWLQLEGAGARGLPRPLRRAGPRRQHLSPRVPRALPVGRRGRLHRSGRPRRLRRVEPARPGPPL